MTATYQLRIYDPTVSKVLDRLGEFYAPITRRALADALCGNYPTKSNLHRTYNIPNRIGHSIKKDVEARLSSRNECLKIEIEDLESRIDLLNKEIVRTKLPARKKYLKQKLRKLRSRLSHRLQQNENTNYSYIFGGKKLWLAQFHLKENGYRSHPEWREDWRLRRNYNFNIIGSSDEKGGNQNCQFLPKENNTFDLQLRLPDGFLSPGQDKYLMISNLEISKKELRKNAKRELLYGWSLVRTLLSENAVAVTYRFHKDKKGWIVSASVGLPEIAITTSHEQGVIGIDINDGFLALTEIDSTGNPLLRKHISLEINGLQANARENAISHAVLEAVQYAKERGKDLVVEHLNFEQKKRELVICQSSARAKMLSSLAYRQILDRFYASAYLRGVAVHAINPAYSSIIGRFKFSSRYGMSVHQAAALVIARRYLGFSERLPKSARAYLYQTGRIQGTLEKPEDSSKHVWTRWATLYRQIRKLWSSVEKRTKDPKLRGNRQPRMMNTSLNLKSKTTTGAVNLGGHNGGDK